MSHILSRPFPEGVDRKLAWKWFVDAVAETTEYAIERGVALGIEAVFGNMFHSTNDYRELAIDLPNVNWKVNYDPSHLIVNGEDPTLILDEMGDRVVHVHLKDGDGLYPKFSFPPLGEGKVEFDAVFRKLDRARYRGWLSVEYEAQVFGWTESEQTILTHGLEFVHSQQRAI